MKRLILMCVTFMLTANLFAQSNKEDIDLIQSMFGKDKKELVNAYMTIPEAQKAKFWSLYDVYETSRKKLGKERIALLEAYANNYETLDNKKATDLTIKKMACLINWCGGKPFIRLYNTCHMPSPASLIWV